MWLSGRHHPSCAGTCTQGDHHVPGEPFYVDIVIVTDGRSEKVMLMNTVIAIILFILY